MLTLQGDHEDQVRFREDQVSTKKLVLCFMKVSVEAKYSGSKGLFLISIFHFHCILILGEPQT